MSGDYTRNTFSPVKDYLAVLMQQGRVMVDADFNALNAILDRHFRSETMDIIGRCVVPKETPEGFRIQVAAGPPQSITIGRGRLYAHGLQAENHGLPPLEYDPILGEHRGTLPIPYDQQPYLPNIAAVSPMPATPGPHLVFADVWQREVTYIEDLDLVDKAIAVDTSTRLQTVWQVKVLPNVGNITCSTPADQIPGWVNTIAPSAGRLTTSAVGVPVDTDPCVVNPTGGFRGTENRLYRVEVHSGGALGATTVKWSRDNASIAVTVTGINTGRTVLTVSRLGRDATSRIQPLDWVEITDDWHEFAGQPGEMRKVQAVDDVLQTVTLQIALTTGSFDTVNPLSRHTRIRKWDQKGLVLDAANAVVADVDASGGVIPMPPGGSFVLEDGVQVNFSVDPAGGSFHNLDYWNFAARTVDASIEILTAEPPRGILHHFCRLAIVTFPNPPVDCRTLWPPDFGDKSCDCSVCVSAAQHNSGTLTIQMAVNQVKATGGKVCLGPGVFNLGTTPVLIGGAQSVQIEGHGWRTILLYRGANAAIGIFGSIGVEIRELLVAAFSDKAASFAVGVLNSLRVRVDNCELIQLGGDARVGACVGLAGIVFDAAFRDNILFGNAGVASVLGADTPALAEQARVGLFLWNIKIEDNLIAALRTGVRLDRFVVHLGDTRIAGNSIYGCAQGGIVTTGLVGASLLSNSRVDVARNDLIISGDGIQAGCASVRVVDNDIGTITPPRQATNFNGGNGIEIGGPQRLRVDRAQVMGNRITRVGGSGIVLTTQVNSVMIKNNIIDSTNSGGIVMEEASGARELSIENNQLTRIAVGNNQVGQRLAAIRVVQCRQVEVASNSIDNVAAVAVLNPARLGIEVVACGSVRICGNDVSNIGPPAQFVNLGAGIFVQAPFDRLDISDNSVRRTLVVSPVADPSQWYAIRIGSFFEKSTSNNLLFPFVTNVGASNFVLLGTLAIIAVPLGKEIAAIRGNLLESYGLVEAVRVELSGACIMNDNRCLATHIKAAAGAVPVVTATTGTVIASANYIEHNPANPANVALRLLSTAGPFSVVGNICKGGRIEANGNPLPAPWAPLNPLF